MVTKETTQFLIDYLYDRISPSVKEGFGDGDASPKKDKEGQLGLLFEKYIFRANLGYFLMSDSGVLYVYNGKYYELVDSQMYLHELIKQVLMKMNVGIPYQTNSFKKIAEDCLNAIEVDYDSQFRVDRNYIVFNNGVLNVKEGKLNDFDMKYRTDLILDIDYKPDAVYPLWDKKLVEIIPNAEMRDAFQMFCGTFLINRSELKVEYICYLIGPGSNGKSTITAAIAAVFGKRYFGKLPPKRLLKSSDSMFNMASLDGKIANLTDDLDKGDLSGGEFKRFVSGDEMPARHPFGHRVFYVSAPLMLCCTNEMPTTTDDSWGHHRRQLPIYSTSRVWSDTDADKDSNLEAKLRTLEARTAIFNWIYEGYRKIMSNGGKIVLGKDVIEAQLELRDDSNSARRWIRDMGFIKIEPTGKKDPRWKSLIEWHNEYKQYCADNGDYNPKNSKSLSKLFKEKEFIQERRNNGVWYCIGILDVDSEAPKPALFEEEDEDLPF